MSDIFKQGPYQPEISEFQNFKNNLGKYSSANKFISGGRVIIKINGIPAPRLSSISWKIGTEQEAVREIDNFCPHELAPRIIDVSGSYSEFREPFRGATIQSQQASVLSFMFHPYITIEVRDNLTDALLFFAGKAAIIDRSETVNTENLVMTTVRWQAIAWKDEMEPVIPAENAGKLEQTPQNPVLGILEGATGLPISGVAGGFLKKLF